MRLYLDLCTAVGFVVLLGMWLSLLWFLIAFGVEGWRGRQRTFVPRSWVEQEQRRRCDRRYPPSDLRHPSFKDDER